MVLNGDGKTNVKLEDSLENLKKYKDQFDIMVCNPPFGVKIKESRESVLQNFDTGHEWTKQTGTWVKSEQTLDAQETGILFAELCLREVAPGGRVGIVVPNGYLGTGAPDIASFVRGSYAARELFQLSACRVSLLRNPVPT